MNCLKNIVVNGSHKRPILIDAFYLENGLPKPIVIFCHGYKGFKDWGAWNMMANRFAEAGFCFIKFNFSHNGGTIEQPIDFPDLEAFASNNYSIELDDLNDVINWVCNNKDLKAEANPNQITLIGHSRGGGIALIKAEEDQRISSVITLAGVSDFKSRFNETSDEFKKWENTGIKYVLNGRTHQQMPHYFQFYEDFIKNESRLTIRRSASNLKIPHLIVHGNKDTSVSVEEAKTLHKWNPNSKLVIIEGANHVFGVSHPWEKTYLPPEFELSINTMINFLGDVHH
jgi:pimeloyl-ACP methyl ester carboxylesterase